MLEERSPWLCHICGYSSTLGEGQACAECYKISGRKHLIVATVHNPQTSLYELKQICVECQFRKTL